MSNVDEVYLENSVIYHHYFENDVRNIGDLWNCRSSQAVGHNLFNKDSLQPKVLRATPLKTCDCKFTHVNNELETAKVQHCDAQLSIDLALCNLKPEFSIKRQSDTSDKTQTETINCRYINENYRIEINQSKELLLNKRVLKLIRDRQINATHVVGGLIVGCSVKAVINITKEDSSKDLGLSGRLALTKADPDISTKNKADSKTTDKDNTKMDDKDKKTPSDQGKDSKKGFFSSICDWVKDVVMNSRAGLGAVWEETDKSHLYDIKIECKVRPCPSNFKPPNSLELLSELIRNMPSIMREEFFGDSIESGKIYGVPIQFTLYPINHFADVDIARLYKKLDNEIMEQFLEMLSKANQYQDNNFFKQVILKRDSRLCFLLDRKSALSDKGNEVQSALKQLGERFIIRSRKQLSKYKCGKCSLEKLIKILRDFEASEARTLEDEIQDLANKGILDIDKAHDTVKDNLRLLTDESDKQEWIDRESNPKIIFEIGPKCSEEIINEYHQLVDPLCGIGIKMALVMRSIAKEFKLSILLDSREKVIYKDSEVQQAIEMLRVNFRIGNQAKANFFAAIAAVKSVEFPVCKTSFNQLYSVFKIITPLLNDYSHFEFVDSISAFQLALSKLCNSEVAFCLPTSASETVLDFFQCWKNFNIKNVKWIAYSFDIGEGHENPLLFLLSKNVNENPCREVVDVLAVCLDHLDLLILEQNIKQCKKICSIKSDLLSVAHLTTSFYKLRAASAFRFLSLINPNPNAFQAPLGNWDKAETNSEIMEFLSFIRICLKSNEFGILAAVAQMAVQDFPILALALQNCGWNGISKNFTQECLNENSCRKVVDEIRKWLKPTDDGLKSKTSKLIVKLSDAQCSETELQEACGNIASDSRCPVGFKVQLQECVEKWKTESPKDIGILEKLKNCDKSMTSHFSYLHVKVLLKALSCFISFENQSAHALMKLLVSEYYACMKPVFDDERMEFYIENNQIYLLLQQASPYKYNKWMYTLMKGLRALRDLEDFNTLTQLIDNLSKVCPEENRIKKLWRNDKWLFLIRNCINLKQQKQDPTLLRAIKNWIKNAEDESILPADIQKRLKSI